MTVPASPLAERMARLSGLKLDDVRGSGENGRIQARDVLNMLGIDRVVAGDASVPSAPDTSTSPRIPAVARLSTRCASGALAEIASGIEGYLAPLPLHHALLFVLAQTLVRNPDMLGPDPDAQTRRTGVHLTFWTDESSRPAHIRHAERYRLGAIAEIASAVEFSSQAMVSPAGKDGHGNFAVAFNHASVNVSHASHFDSQRMPVLVLAPAPENDEFILTLEFGEQIASRRAAQAFFDDLIRAIEDPRRLIL